MTLKRSKNTNKQNGTDIHSNDEKSCNIVSFFKSTNIYNKAYSLQQSAIPKHFSFFSLNSINFIVLLLVVFKNSNHPLEGSTTMSIALCVNK